nr:putative ribonuclease H-like domain-containing protein [Tanacetum cinerariifolium]
MYVIDVEPILPCNRNNREVHLDYLKHLKESVPTLREIVEEARVEKPFDSLLLSTCRYTNTLRNQFCDSDMEVAFRKHSCYVRDTDGVELIKACQLGKSKKHTHKPKAENTNLEVLHTLHMDLCGPMRVQTLNGKKYILVIVDDYSRFTWVKFLRSKDETPEFVIKFLKQIQVGLNKTVRYICTDNDTKFVNRDMTQYYESVSIFHQNSVPRTPQQNGVVERQNHTLVEASRTMLIFSKAPMFLWAEAIATAYLEILFQPMFNEYLEPPRVKRPVSPAPSVLVLVNTAGTPSFTTIDQDAPSPSHSPSSSALQSLSLQQSVTAESTIMEDNPLAPVDNDPFINVFSLEPISEASSSGDAFTFCVSGRGLPNILDSGKAGTYGFELDEPRFILDANLLREALELTPIDQAHLFMSPPSSEAIMDFVDELGYTEAIQTFLTDKANLGSPTKKGRKDMPHVIPYCRFRKLIICHLGKIHNIHQRSASPFHLAKEEFRLGNLKFVSKGEADDVFGMPIPNELISNNIRNAPYYNAYLEIVAKHDQKVVAKKEGKMKTASAKQPTSKHAIEKSRKLAPKLKLKAAKERPYKASTAKPPKLKPAKEKSAKTTPPQQASKAQSEPKPELKHLGKGDKDDMERAIQIKGKGKAIVTEEQAAYSLLALYTLKRRSTTNQFIFQRRTPAIEVSSFGPPAQAQDDTSANIICDSPSPADAETGVASEKTNSGGDTEILHIDEEQGKDVDYQVNLKEKTDKLDQGQAGSDPDPGESLGALTELDLKPTHDKFMADMYLKVQESLKFLADEHVILEDPISSTETLSFMKNLEDAYAIGDQFINDKSTKDGPEKPNAEGKVVSMVTVPIYQSSSSLPPLSTPVPIDEVVRESVKEAIHVALQAPLQDRFRELPEADIKEILHQRMFKNDPPPPLPDSDLGKRRRHDTGTSGSSQSQAPQSSAWKKTDTRDAPPSFSKQQSDPHDEQPRPEWLKPILDDERPVTSESALVIPTSHIPDGVNNWANALATTYQDLAENSLLEKTEDMRTLMHWYYQQIGKTELTQADLEGQAYEVVKAFYPDVVHLQLQMEECHKMLKDQIDYRQALLISKMKAARYLDFGLELLVPKHLWINEKFYIDRHIADSSRKVVRTHICILSVVSIKAYSRYGYDYLKEITLRRANYQEYTTVEKDFKNLYPSDFEDLNLLLLQGFEYKHDYTIIESPRAVVFPVSNNEQKIMRDSRPEASSKTWNALLVVEYELLTTDSSREPNEHIISAFRSKCENKEIVQSEMKLELEQTQQGSSHKVSISTKRVEELKRNVRIKGVKKESLYTLRAETGSTHLLSESH